MTADVCPTDYFCNQCGSDRKDKKHISIWSGLPCDNQWHDEPAPSEPQAFDFLAHLQRQRDWSEKTFGPGKRTAGVCDHIRKELVEIEADPEDISEWIDVAILALDGAWRAGYQPQQIIDALVAKQTKNEGRTWPDWRTMPTDKAIEHDRSQDKPAEPVSATPIEPVALRHFAGAFMVIEYHDITPAILEGKVWEIDPAWERLYSQQSIDNLLRKLAEAKHALRVSALHNKYEGGNLHDWWERAIKSEARAAELQSELEGFKAGHEEDEAHILEQDATIKTLQAKLDAETAKYNLSVEAMAILQESLDQERTFSQSETARADGAHNAAIDKCIKALAHDSLAVRILLPFKVPQ